MSADVDVVAGGVAGGTSMYTNALFSNWQADYVAALELALSSGITPEVIGSELDRALSVAGSTLDADPYLDGSSEAAVAALDAWWAQRFEAVASQLSAAP
jgi:hypothetical protein